MRIGLQSVVLLTGFMVCLAGPAYGQRPGNVPDAREIGELIRKNGVGSRALSVLIQLDGPQPQTKLDAIADTLALIVISHPGNDTSALRVRRVALEALMFSAIAVQRGTPYPGAADRLLRIVEDAANAGDRGAALYAISVLPNSQRARELLSQVATSQNPIAGAAVSHLANSMGPEGLAILRNLYRTAAVTERSARQALETLAYHSHWPPPPFGPPESRPKR